MKWAGRCAVGGADLLALLRSPGMSTGAKGLWRRLVAHLVRIEGVRGSNPLSSTRTFFDLRKRRAKIVSTDRAQPEMTVVRGSDAQPSHWVLCAMASRVRYC
jgi:hypothetical protein